MKKVLFDTNIILDIVLERAPYLNNATKLFSLIGEKKIIGHITASAITDIYYISKKAKGHERALAFITDLIEVVEVVGVDRDIIAKALHLEMKDFEDAVQVSAAEFAEIEYLITRNTQDFVNAQLKVYDPGDFLEKQK